MSFAAGFIIRIYIQRKRRKLLIGFHRIYILFYRSRCNSNRTHDDLCKVKEIFFFLVDCAVDEKVKVQVEKAFFFK